MQIFPCRKIWNQDFKSFGNLFLKLKILWTFELRTYYQCGESIITVHFNYSILGHVSCHYWFWPDPNLVLPWSRFNIHLVEIKVGYICNNLKKWLFRKWRMGMKLQFIALEGRVWILTTWEALKMSSYDKF